MSVYYCIENEAGVVSFPVKVPRVVVFVNAKGRQYSVTQPTETDLGGHGYFNGNRFPADQAPDLLPGEKYGAPVIVEGRGVVPVVPMTAEEIKATTPQVVSMRQARVYLEREGLLATVTDQVAALGKEAQLTWDNSQEVQRDNPLVSALGFTEEQLNAMFVEASKI